MASSIDVFEGSQVMRVLAALAALVVAISPSGWARPGSVVRRPQRCDQQDANEGANEDGGNPASQWGAEIHVDDARRVISHGTKAIGVWGFI